ncbi:MAG: Protein acetyltransferase [Nevskia sp.]|nr:Protein acetyltransferase [Nevskia sp.]
MTIRNLDALFAPPQLLVLGAPQYAWSKTWIDNIAASLPAERRTLIGARRADWNCVGQHSAWPQADAAVLLDDQLAEPGLLAKLVRGGCRALIAAAPAIRLPELLEEGRVQLLRVLGPRAAGIIAPLHGLNLSGFSLMPPCGSIALIAQSQSVAAAAIDWAVGRHIGFSWIAATGAEADVDVGDLLDRAALDPATRSVVLQLGRVRGGRKLMSAARACARAKLVVVLQTRSGNAVGSAGPDGLRSAAFRRAGLVECESLAALFDALTALERLPPLQSSRVTVVGNGAGVCALGVDALLRQQLIPAEIDAATHQRIAAVVPHARFPPGAIDLGAVDEVLLMQALTEVLACTKADAVLLIRSPTATPTHQQIAAAVAAAGFGKRLLTVWLGLETALPARSLSARAGLATFTSADAAARALRYRWQYHRTQQLLTETPASPPLNHGDGETLRDRLQRHLAADQLHLSEDAAAAVLLACGLARSTSASVLAPLAVQIRPHAEFGMALRLQPQVAGVRTDCSYALPPLDDLLALRALEEAGYPSDAHRAEIARLVEGLIRLSQLVTEHAAITALDAVLVVSATTVACRAGAQIELSRSPLPPRRRLALAPYPAELIHVISAQDGRQYRLRPVRPSDEPALLHLLGQIPPEDIRLRFFGYIRQFSHTMAARMTQVDYDRELALVAEPLESADGAGGIVAIATLIADPDDAQAEFGVLVHHTYGSAGIGRHLLEQLIAHAVRRGIGTVIGEVLRENTRMRALARRVGFRETVDPDDQTCMRIAITPSAASAA